MPSRAKVFELAKGFRGRAKNCISIARERVEKALQFAYRDRRTRQRDARSLWIQQINAGVRLYGVRFPRPRGARRGAVALRCRPSGPPGARLHGSSGSRGYAPPLPHA